jgi:DNA repair exonuclease SbcCD ATPase subunit
MFNQILKRIQVRNFRRNTKLDVELEGITVIRGPSGKGKSSFVGALKWSVFNRPTSTRFIRWGAEFAAVRLVFSDGAIATRKRSKTQNYYKLRGPGDTKDTVYKAFGTDVPQDITNLLNMTDINFHSQHSSPFWFSETAGEVSRQLNAIVNLEVIDRTASNLARMMREETAEVKGISERLEEASERAGELKFILRADRVLQAIEKEQAEAAKTQQEALSLRNACRAALSYRKRHKRLLRLGLLGGIALADGGRHAETWGQEQRLSDLVTQASRHTQILARKIPDISPLSKLYDTWQEAKRDWQRLKLLFDQATAYEIFLLQEDPTEDLQKKFDKMMGPKCVLCGAKLKGKKNGC